MKNIETNIHDLIHLIRLVSAAQTLHLALQGATEDLLHHGGGAGSGAAVPLPSELLEAETGVVACVDNVAEELVRVLLATAAEVLGEDP